MTDRTADRTQDRDEEWGTAPEMIIVPASSGWHAPAVCAASSQQ